MLVHCTNKIYLPSLFICRSHWLLSMLMVQQLCQRKKWCDHIGRPAKAKARAIGQRKQGHWMQSDSKERRSLWSSVAVSVRFSFK